GKLAIVAAPNGKTSPLALEPVDRSRSGCPSQSSNPTFQSNFPIQSKQTARRIQQDKQTRGKLPITRVQGVCPLSVQDRLLIRSKAVMPQNGALLPQSYPGFLCCRPMLGKELEKLHE
ncbi:MAG: hypothetical protein O7E57_02890, partial [Gammaproteobacteria bacterium]|nr:hypothetical protein [Gammaproteobacteria bacterium]